MNKEINQKILTEIIRENGDREYKAEIPKYSYMNKESLISGGIPYNIYLLIQTTFENGSDYHYCFVKLFEDVDFPATQKLDLIELIEDVRKVNHYSKNYGVAGQKAIFLNCDIYSRMKQVNNQNKYDKKYSEIKKCVLNAEQNKDKFDNLQWTFNYIRFTSIEKRPIYPLIVMGQIPITGKQGANCTDIQIIMGIPLEIQ